MTESEWNERIVCPCCGKTSSYLTLCDSCEWEDYLENEKHQNLLNEIKPHSGDHAYAGHGCMVCGECEEAFYFKPYYCPVHLFYGNGLYSLVVSQQEKKPDRLINGLVNYWREQSLDTETLEYRCKLLSQSAKNLKNLLERSP
jgi:hypothetical protein